MYVLHDQSVPDYAQWVEQSPDHFHVFFHFPTLSPKSWAERREFEWKKMRVCGSCVDARYLHLERVREFETDAERKPLRIFDPFAGVGALSLGLERAGGMKLTHAVEISPSAAQTLKCVSLPSLTAGHDVDYAIEITAPLRLCTINVLMRFTATRFAGTSFARMRRCGICITSCSLHLPSREISTASLLDFLGAWSSRTPSLRLTHRAIPRSQPHSTLNMFQKANDVKSHLILNLLSWVDFLEPKYCVFENVKGFLQYNPGAVQVDIHRVEGGIEMGGLRFLVHAMLSMKCVSTLHFSLLHFTSRS